MVLVCWVAQSSHSEMTAAPSAFEPLITDWLGHAAKIYPDHLALIDLATSRRFTYRQMFERVSRLAGALTKLGLKRSDRVMIVARNSTDIYEMMFAAWRLGAAFMLTNWRLAPPELAEILNDAEPALIIIDEEFAHSIDCKNTPVLRRKPGDSHSEYERAIADSPPRLDFAAQSLDDLNVLLYTSGTTGRPKGVIGTWRMTLTMLLQSSISARLGPGCVTLTAAPLFHTAGLNSFATPTLHVGGTLAVMGQWQPEACLDLLADPNLAVTHTLGVPTQFIAMAQHPKFARVKFPSLRTAGVGGAPPTEDLMDTWAAKGLALVPGYGMTEAFGVTSITATEARAKPGAVGRAQIFMQLRIADDDGNELPSGTVGEIQLKGPGVTPGYWKQPVLTAEAFIDGWFRTGDMGHMDSDGLLYVADRKKDMFISGGENVYPVEIENLMAGFPEIAHVAIIGVPDPTWGEVGRAVIVLRPGAAIDTAEILMRCRGKIAPYKIPKSIVVVTKLPLSAQGKVLKTELRRRHG
ncbi:MAG: long-chain fatty acid--CoA ligase [Rhodospirillaceae bacterium]|nr:long-chain fatty acid--CoA ligase [Rhodospirillaceae bacterium]